MTTSRQTRFNLFLNTFEGMAFTRCPKCDAKTKQRKLPLVIHIEPHMMGVLNKTCRFCPGCELVIVRQSELDPLLATMAPKDQSRVKRGEYLIVGTLDREDWREGFVGRSSPADVAETVWLFKDQWFFEIRGGWMPADDSAVE